MLVRLALIAGLLQQWRSVVLRSMSDRDPRRIGGRSSPTLKIFRPVSPMATEERSMSDRDPVAVRFFCKRNGERSLLTFSKLMAVRVFAAFCRHHSLSCLDHAVFVDSPSVQANDGPRYAHMSL